MIDNVQMYYQHHGETCVATLEVHTSSGTILKTIDLSGNTVPSYLCEGTADFRRQVNRIVLS